MLTDNTIVSEKL